MPHLIAQEGPLKGLVLDLEDGEEWIVGRDPDEADLLTEDATISRKHLRITRSGDEFFLKNISRTSPTLINDEPIQPNVPLRTGDKIKIGENIFVFSEEAAPASEEPEPKKASGGYDNIFGDLEEPELPPEPEPIETAAPIETEEPRAAKSSYDTIFEDIEAESEMPFNLLAETPLVLKVIGGPNAGAEIGLEKGRSYLLGKDSNSCDIVFQDLSVSRSHARLSVSESGIIDLEDLGSKNSTIVNGSPIAGKKIVTSQDLIAMGTTVFLIIDREAAQETIFSPAIPAYEAANTAEKAAPPPEEEKEEEPKEEKPEEIDWKQEKIPPKHLIFGGAAAAIFLIVFISFFSLFKSENIELAVKLPHDAIKEALAPYPAVHYSYNPTAQKLFLAGHVLTAIDYQELLFNLEQISEIAATENNVVVDEGVSKAMNDMLSAHADWQGISITATEPGRFIAQGYVKTADEGAQAAEYLVLNFPYVDQLQNRIVVEDLLRIQIQGTLIASGLGGVVSQVANGNVLLTGSYPKDHDSAFDKAVNHINKLQGVRSVRSFAIAVSGESGGTDVTKQYAVTGTALHDAKGYSAIINGRIYTIGQSVDGMNIISIGSDTIFLEKDGMKYKISFTR